MFEKLKAIEDKFNEINEKLMQPETVNNSELYTSLIKEYKQLEPIINKLKSIRVSRHRMMRRLNCLTRVVLTRSSKSLHKCSLMKQSSRCLRLKKN